MGHAEEVEGKDVNEETDASVKEIELEKDLKHEEDFTKAMISLDDGRKEDKKEHYNHFSVSVTVVKTREMQILSDADEVEGKEVLKKKTLPLKVLNLARRQS